MVKIGIFNQKGGVAKTTSTFNIAGYLAKNFNKKVLIIDTDPQANLTKSMLSESEFGENDFTLVDCIENDTDVNEVIKTSLLRSRGNAKPKDLGIDVLPTERKMIATKVENDNVFQKLFEGIKKEYDYVLIDFPPFLSEITVSVLTSVDYIIVPASVDYDSLSGYGELLDTINTIKLNGLNEKIEILGIFLTMFNKNETFDKYVYEDCKNNFGEQLFTTTIRRSTQAKQSSYFGTPLSWFKPYCNVAKDYEELTNEIVKKIERRK